jgi:hypothetical protein
MPVRHARLCRLGAAIVLLQAVAATAQAEPIPQETLIADQRSCVASCTQQGVPMATCTPYCECTFKQVGKQFSLEEYAAGRTAAEQNQPTPKALVDRMNAISKSCLADMK